MNTIIKIPIKIPSIGSKIVKQMFGVDIMVEYLGGRQLVIYLRFNNKKYGIDKISGPNPFGEMRASEGNK